MAMRTSTADYFFLRWISGLPVQREMIENVAYLYNFAEDIPIDVLNDIEVTQL